MKEIKFFIESRERCNYLYVISIFILLQIFNTNISWSQNQNSDTLNKTPETKRSVTPSDSGHIDPNNLPVVQVVDAYKLGMDSITDKKERNSAGIGDIIVVKVKNLKTLLNRSKCVDTNGKPLPGCKEQEIRLFIEGRMMKDIAPESGAPQKEDGELQYHLERNENNDEEWADILGAPKDGNFFYKPAKISVGLENEYAENSIANFNMIRIKSTWFIVCAICLLAYYISLSIYAKKSSLLRDRAIDASALGISNAGVKSPYSLGRFQMAFWFSLVITSFLFIWLITGAYDIITPAILGLIGISVGTSLSAVVIDDNKQQELLNTTSLLIAEQNALQTDIPALKSNIATALNTAPVPLNLAGLQTTLNDKQLRLQQIQPELTKNLAALVPKKSRDFFKDILWDANGISFHRLQMFVWTWVLGILFIYSVWVRLSMPEFSATLLGLQGLTAGTYLGFKIPEKQS
jgi:hypothetical protein